MPPMEGVYKGVYLKTLERAELSFCDGSASFLQSGFWGGFKARFGWEALAFKGEWASGNETNSAPEARPLLVLRRCLAAGFSLAYIPWGPELPDDFPADARNAALTELAGFLRNALPKNTVFIRFDPPWYTQEPETPAPLPLPFIRSGADIQAPDTVLLDLTQGVESLIEKMKPKWRYNAGLALKRGVTVRRAGAEETGVFYDLLKETAGRDGIAIHSIEYYREILLDAAVRLYLAEHDGEAIAGIVTLFRGKEAYYLYGASSGKKRSLMAPYALQLKAMEDAGAAGCGEYDLFGIPPNEDPSHPMAGLYRFKTGFGGRIIHRPGSWDYPCNLLLYRLFRWAESLRKNIRTRKKRKRERQLIR